MVSEDHAPHGVRYQLVLRPRADIVPATVNRYLLPGEHLATVIRQHPVMLAPASASAIGVLLAAVIAGVTSHGNPGLILLIWTIWGFFVLRLGMIVTNWMAQYIAITDKQVVLTSGLTTRAVTVIRLTDLNGLTLERSMPGRLMGYGSFRIGSDGAGQLIIGYVPYPEQIYLDLRARIRAAEDEAASD